MAEYKSSGHSRPPSRTKKNPPRKPQPVLTQYSDISDGSAEDDKNDGDDLSKLREDIKIAMKEYESFINTEGLEKTSLTLRERLLLLKTDLPSKVVIMRRYEEVFSSVDGGRMNAEIAKGNAWLNNCLQLPFGRIKPLGVNYDDGQDKITEYLVNVRNVMDQSVYAHDKAKDDILCFVCRSVTAHTKTSGKVLALCGPPGCGKTRLIRQALHNGLGLPFFSINCGGLNDASVLLGHDYTYLGSKPGKIAQILAMSKYMNCIIYLDELDKISGTKASDISGVLTHMLDPEQNTQFQDTYFQGVNIDVSNVLFVLSFNDMNKVDLIARDRMKIIEVHENTFEEKGHIAKMFLIPEVLASVGLQPGDVIFPDDVVGYIITMAKEPGMRKTRQIFESLVERINILRITGFKSNDRLKLSFNADISEMPVLVTMTLINSLLPISAKALGINLQ